MQSFTDSSVWQIGLALTKDIYVLTSKFPQQEMYGMTAQMRRSSTSILANIAEGFGRYTYPDKANKYIIARAECAETEAFILIALALNFMKEDEANNVLQRCREVGRMISGLITFCKNKS